jgi:hypothetical protein
VAPIIPVAKLKIPPAINGRYRSVKCRWRTSPTTVADVVVQSSRDPPSMIATRRRSELRRHLFLAQRPASFLGALINFATLVTKRAFVHLAVTQSREWGLDSGSIRSSGDQPAPNLGAQLGYGDEIVTKVVY